MGSSLQIYATVTLAFVVASGCGRIGFKELLDSYTGPTGTGGAAGADPADGSNPFSDAATDGAGGAGTTDAGGAGADGGDAAADAGPTNVVVLVTPLAKAILTSESAQFFADVTGTTNTSVTWSVAEGAPGGAVTSTGAYTAPTTPGTYHVVGTSVANPAVSASAIVVVSLPAGTAIATAVDVTPPGISLDPMYDPAGGNFGIMDVIVDPARPSDLYAWVSFQGVWRSTDYGQTWAKISANGGPLDDGRTGSAAIDPNPDRNPATPPTLYTVRGAALPYAVFKSTDGGVTWTTHTIPGAPGQDITAIDVDPYDGNHVIAGFASGSLWAETTDGAMTFTSLTGPSSTTANVYPAFVDTGHPATTRTTWLAFGQGMGPVYRTVNAAATWTQSGAFGHTTGGMQFFQDGAGAMYAPGPNEVYASTDFGATWMPFHAAAIGEVTATPTYLYIWNGWANRAGVNPNMARAPRSTGGPWTPVPTPAAMTNGAKRVAVTYDGTHYVLVGGNFQAGIWRYVEP